MKIVPVSVDELKVQGITIGRRDTYGTEQVEFDLTELIDTYGDGSAILMVKRKLDETAYPATTEQADGKLLWTVSEIDTAYKGKGECEIFWYVDGNLAKTVIYTISIMRDIGETTEEPPDPYETWVDELTALGAETLENARNAAESASEAKVSELNAKDSEEASQRSETKSGENALKSEGFAVGEQAGTPVGSGSPYYHNNAKFYSEESERVGRENATLAESWAVGGTGTRPGEDTNNAKYYSDLAAQSAEESGYAWFDVHDDDGIMYVYISDNLSEDVSFEVNENTGVLEVTYN